MTTGFFVVTTGFFVVTIDLVVLRVVWAASYIKTFVHKITIVTLNRMIPGYKIKIRLVILKPKSIVLPR